MATSDDELQARRDRVEKLRAQVENEKAKQYAVQAEVSSDLEARQLDAEQERLEAELAALKANNTKTAVRAAAAPIVDAVKDEQKAAHAATAAIGAGEGEGAK